MHHSVAQAGLRRRPRPSTLYNLLNDRLGARPGDHQLRRGVLGRGSRQASPHRAARGLPQARRERSAGGAAPGAVGRPSAEKPGFLDRLGSWPPLERRLFLGRRSPQGAVSGQANVLAKRGRTVGGNAVDGWVLDDLCRQMGHRLSEDDDEVTRLWRRLMLAEACRVKEAVFFQPEEAFLMSPERSLLPAAARQGRGFVALTRDRLREILDEQGFYRSLSASVDEVLEQGGVTAGEVDDVVLVGGSTLLPGFFSWFEERFERRRVRAWQPFEAVAFGAACFAGDRMDALDFVVHDYAFVIHDPKTGEAQQTIIVPRGTRFPTSPELWKRQLVPTCALGEPESLFKLLICEVSRPDGDPSRFVWDAAGDVHKVGGG